MELNIGKSKTHGVKAGEIMVISKCLEELMNVMLNQELGSHNDEERS